MKQKKLLLTAVFGPYGVKDKYGEDIGKMVGPAKQGEHVHTHNCKTKRW